MLKGKTQRKKKLNTNISKQIAEIEIERKRQKDKTKGKKSCEMIKIGKEVKE